MAKKRGLYDNINAKRNRIKAGSGEKMRSPGDKGAPSAQDFKDAAKTAKMAEGGMYKMAGGGMPGGTMLKMKDGGLAVQSKGCGTVDNKRRKPTKLR
tara:strand:+ start:86 stop:376 length:291 start_codon:yes stop_codon:yes gene_type:complete